MSMCVQLNPELGLIMMGIGSIGSGVGGGVRVSGFHQWSGGVLERSGIVMNRVMNGLCVHFDNGLGMGHHLTEASIALGEGSSHCFDDRRCVVGQGVGGGMVHVRSGCCVIWSGMMDEGSGVFHCSWCIVRAGVRTGIWTGVWNNRCSCNGGNKQAQDLQMINF